MAKLNDWVADGLNIFYRSALIVRCGDLSTAAQIVREHNSHKGLVGVCGDSLFLFRQVVLSCPHMKYKDIIVDIKAALALAEVKK
jgi:hypothetical protein